MPKTTPERIWRWSNLRGYCARGNPAQFPEGIGTVATNIQLKTGTLGKRRIATTAQTMTSGPTGNLYALGSYEPVTAAGIDTSQLWAFEVGGAFFRLPSGGAWTTVTVSDAAGAGDYGPSALTFNNKLYVAYNSAVNRLHVWDGTSLRRVGLSKPSAPTVADTGAGAYAATARRYRVSFRLKSGSDIVCESELSEAVSFTPSGAGAAARVTKPTTVDSATHWVVWGLISSSGDTYDLYEHLSEIAVGTTTYDDSTAPASYAGDAPAPLGTHIPPPSCRFMAKDGNRLVFAGAFETSGSAGETQPKASRVWYTRVLGASDNGDDETIPNTTEQSNWIDVGGNDGDVIRGLAAITGVIYVFKYHHIYAMYPTGVDTAPYRVELVSTAAGLDTTGEVPQRAVVVAGQDVYFPSASGIYRLSPQSGLEYVGWDIHGDNDAVTFGGYDEEWQQVYWLEPTNNVLFVYNPAFARINQEGWRGGWTKWTLAHRTNIQVMTMYNRSGANNPRLLTVGGTTGGSTYVDYFDSASATDASNQTFTVTATSGTLLLNGGASRFSARAPILEAAVQSGTNTPTVAFVLDYGRETRSTTVSLAGSGSATHVAAVVHDLFASDVQALQVTVTWDTDQYFASDKQDGAIGAVIVRYAEREPV